MRKCNVAEKIFDMFVLFDFSVAILSIVGAIITRVIGAMQFCNACSDVFVFAVLLYIIVGFIRYGREI